MITISKVLYSGRSLNYGLMHHARGVSIIVGLCTAIFLLAIYSGRTFAAQPSLIMPAFKITVTNGQGLYGLPWHVGVSNGIFRRHGLKIDRILDGRGGSATLRQFTSGDLPFSSVSFGAVVRGFKAGVPVKVIGGGTQAIDDLVYVTNPGSDINSIYDMKGKRWGYTNPGSGTDVQAYLLPKLAGMSPYSFEHVATGGVGEGIALLQSHSVDMVYIPTYLYYQNPDAYKVVFYPSQYAPWMQISSIVADPEALKKHPNAAKALLASYSQSVRWIAQHPKKTAKLWVSYNDMDASIALKVIDRAIEHHHWGAGFNDKALSTAAKGISLIKKGPQSIPWCTLFTTDYLPSGVKGSFPNESSCK